MLEERRGQRGSRIADLRREGLAAYATSPGWLGYKRSRRWLFAFTSPDAGVGRRASGEDAGRGGDAVIEGSGRCGAEELC